MAQTNGHAPDLERYAFFLRYPPQHGGERRRPKGDTTVATYCYTVQRYLRFLNGGEVGQATAEGFVLHLEKVGNSPRSVGRHIYALQSYFAFQKVPLELGAPAYPKRLPRWFDDAEWQRLLAYSTQALRAAAPPRKARERALFNRAALMVYAGAGLRLSEGIGLRREHVDPRGYIRVLGKGGEENIVPVEDAVVLAIQEWAATHSSEWVFPGRSPGRHISRGAMQDAIRTLERETGLTNIRRAVHTLRHTAGAGLREQGADIRDIQQVLRHKNITTTQLYTQMTSAVLRKKLPKRFIDYRQGRLV